MTTVNILSGGAAQGLVRGLSEAFKAQTGFGIDGEFGAVGLMADKLRASTAADLVILTQALLAKLAAEKLVAPSSIADIGRVETALAVRSNDPKVNVKTEAELPRPRPPASTSQRCWISSASPMRSRRA